MKRGFVIGVALVIAVCVISAIIYTFPRTYVFTAEATIINKLDDQIEHSTFIHMKGKMKRNLRGEQIFTGVINAEDAQIPGLDLAGMDMSIAEQYRELNLNFGKNGYAPIFKPIYDYDSRRNYLFSGILYVDQDFNRITIQIASRNDQRGYMIAAPARSREEAAAIANELTTSWRWE